MVLKWLPGTRDVRDTLFWLAVIASVIAPQVTHLPLWTSVLCVGVLLWRGVLAIRQRPLPGRWWVGGLSLLVLTAALFSHRVFFGLEAGVTLVICMLALKTLELRAQRDAFVVFFLGFFALLTQLFYSQSLLTALGLLLSFWGLLTALVQSQKTVGQPSLWRSARLSGQLVLWGIPIMVLLFVLFPRVGPLWGGLMDTGTGRSGLSATMQVGRIARLALDDTVVMRLQFEGRQPQAHELYFRGPVLTHFDGRVWRPRPEALPLQASAPFAIVSGEPLRYELTLEPQDHNWLFVLEATPHAPEGLAEPPRLTRELQWLSAHPVNELIRYRASSYPQFQYGQVSPASKVADWVDNVRLPPAYNPRTQAWARQWRSSLGSDAAFIAAAIQTLRQGGYRYTLEPGVFGPHSADEFWFERKQGFCEHIAASFVILMRAAGIPARVVTGYQGGERNPMDGVWVVRQSDAHAWSEVWLPNVGWQRIDPTAAVAPLRVGDLRQVEAPRGPLNRMLVTVRSGLAQGLRHVWQTMNHRWNQWVLNYSPRRQLDLLRGMGIRQPEVGHLNGLLIVGMLLMAAVTLVQARSQPRRDPWLRLLQQARQRLQHLGLHVPVSCPPRTMAGLLQAQFGGQTSWVLVWRDWLLRLEALRYAPHVQVHAWAHRHARQMQLRVLAGELTKLPTR